VRVLYYPYPSIELSKWVGTREPSGPLRVRVGLG